MDQELINKILINVGSEVVNFLNLKPMRDQPGQYKSAWGSKTLQGLGACIFRIIDEQVDCYDVELNNFLPSAYKEEKKGST